jgi:hypothetical protein
MLSAAALKRQPEPVSLWATVEIVFSYGRTSREQPVVSYDVTVTHQRMSCPFIALASLGMADKPHCLNQTHAAALNGLQQVMQLRKPIAFCGALH